MSDVDNQFSRIAAYINAASTPQERARRKAETFHLIYGSPMKFGGKLANFLVQSTDAQLRGNHRWPVAFDTADGKHHVVEVLGTVTGRFDSRDPPDTKGN